jgi:hypothetical protein
MFLTPPLTPAPAGAESNGKQSPHMPWLASAQPRPTTAAKWRGGEAPKLGRGLIRASGSIFEKFSGAGKEKSCQSPMPIHCSSMAKIIRRTLLVLTSVILAVCIFFIGDFWVKRKAWDVAWRYEGMNKTTAQPKVSKISDGGKYWILEGTAGCFVSMPFSLRLDKETMVLSQSDGSVISYPQKNPPPRRGWVH